MPEKPYFYTVYHDETTGEYFLEVVCGTAAIYLFRIKLRKNEIENFLEDETAIEQLAYRIMDAPKSFPRAKFDILLI